MLTGETQSSAEGSSSGDWGDGRAVLAKAASSLCDKGQKLHGVLNKRNQNRLYASWIILWHCYVYFFLPPSVPLSLPSPPCPLPVSLPLSLACPPIDSHALTSFTTSRPPTLFFLSICLSENCIGDHLVELLSWVLIPTGRYSQMSALYSSSIVLCIRCV